jgi:hypothetical protein
VSYEGLRLTSPQPATTNVTVPDLCLRGASPNCDLGIAPPSDASLLGVLSGYPLPNGPELFTPCDPTSGDPNCPTSGSFTGQEASGLSRYFASWSNPGTINSTSVRFDHLVRDKHRFFFRFSNSTSSTGLRGYVGVGDSPSVNTISDSTVRTYTAGASSLLTNRVSNDFRLNYTTSESIGTKVIEPIGGSSPVDLLQPAGLSAGSNAQFCIFNPAGNCVGLNQGRWSGATRQWNLVDSVSVSVGRHEFKFGADFRRLTPDAVVEPKSVGYIYYAQSPNSGTSTVETDTGSALIEAENSAYPLYKQFSAFAQDEWRATSRLNFSMGLRWEVNPPPGVTQGLMPYTLAGSSIDTLKAAPQGTPLWKTTWFNFAPRLGAAYVIHQQQDWMTVIRGGGGVFFDTGQQDGSLGFAGPGFTSFNFGSGSYGGQWCDFNGNCSSTPAGLILPIQNPPQPGYLGYGFSPHLQLPYTLHWNASLEQAMGKSQAVTVSYVGSHAARLLQANQFQPKNNPDVFYIIMVQNGLTADYNALETQFTRRLSRGLTVLASYTWSHCIDYGSENGVFGYQRGNCDFDIRHNFSGAFSYTLPNIGHGGFADALLHHWGVDNRFTARGAFPITLLGNGFNGPDGKHYNAGLNLIPGTPVYVYRSNCASVLQAALELQPGQTCPGGKAINPNAFMNAASPTTFGTAPRNFARLFGAWQMDLAVRREFPIQERVTLQFRAEAFNVFNHPNFGNVDESFGDPSFGLATGTLATALNTESALYQLGGPRSMQFALKLVF